MPNLLRDQSMVQVMIGQCEAWLRTGKAFLTEAVREMWAAACANTITLDHRANLRLATTHGIRLAAQIIDAVYSAAGATAVYEDNVLQRYFQLQTSSPSPFSFTPSGPADHTRKLVSEGNPPVFELGRGFATQLSPSSFWYLSRRGPPW